MALPGQSKCCDSRRAGAAWAQLPRSLYQLHTGTSCLFDLAVVVVVFVVLITSCSSSMVCRRSLVSCNPILVYYYYRKKVCAGWLVEAIEQKSDFTICCMALVADCVVYEIKEGGSNAIGRVPVSFKWVRFLFQSEEAAASACVALRFPMPQ